MNMDGDSRKGTVLDWSSSMDGWSWSGTTGSGRVGGQMDEGRGPWKHLPI